MVRFDSQERQTLVVLRLGESDLKAMSMGGGNGRVSEFWLFESLWISFVGKSGIKWEKVVNSYLRKPLLRSDTVHR